MKAYRWLLLVGFGMIMLGLVLIFGAFFGPERGTRPLVVCIIGAICVHAGYVLAIFGWAFYRGQRPDVDQRPDVQIVGSHRTQHIRPAFFLVLAIPLVSGFALCAVFPQLSFKAAASLFIIPVMILMNLPSVEKRIFYTPTRSDQPTAEQALESARRNRLWADVSLGMVPLAFVLGVLLLAFNPPQEENPQGGVGGFICCFGLILLVVASPVAALIFYGNALHQETLATKEPPGGNNEPNQETRPGT